MDPGTETTKVRARGDHQKGMIKSCLREEDIDGAGNVVIVGSNKVEGVVYGTSPWGKQMGDFEVRG